MDSKYPFWIHLSNIVSLAISIDNNRLHFSKKSVFLQFLQDSLKKGAFAKFYKNFKSVFMGFAFGGDGYIPNDSKERKKYFFLSFLKTRKWLR
jgi:hypothetical protein